MNLVEQLKQDMVTAMKEKDKDRLTVIRMVKAALDKDRIDKQMNLSKFDYVWLSYELKYRKPEIEIYEIVEKTSGISFLSFFYFFCKWNYDWANSNRLIYNADIRADKNIVN